jgi:hypothetical protein
MELQIFIQQWPIQIRSKNNQLSVLYNFISSTHDTKL